MLRDMREELRKEKPANMEMAAMPVPVDTTTLHGGKEGRWWNLAIYPLVMTNIAVV